MIEELIEKTKQRHQQQPIAQETYDRWRRLTVTKRFFEELELIVLKSSRDPIDDDSIDTIAIQSIVRDSALETIWAVLDWSPAGVEGPNDGD